MSEKKHTIDKGIGVEAINVDELFGYILRNAYEKGTHLSYEEVKAVLDGETSFLRKKGLIQDKISHETSERQEGKHNYFG